MLGDMLLPDSDVLVQVLPNDRTTVCFRQLVKMAETFLEAFFMQATAFFNATMRGAFSASAPTVAYARQLLHVRFVPARDECVIDRSDAPKWGLLDDV